ncbi:MAG: hypothetical protein PVJ04_04600 [Gemmatimonadota bacterium]|jgi:hypothetical protein
MRRFGKATMAILLLGVGFLLGGCGTASTQRAGVRHDQRVLTAEEIEGSGFNDAFSVVQALRPHWLSTRGTSSINQPQFIKVYLDNNLLGGTESLRTIPVNTIARMEYLDGLEASNRWGLDHGLGAIMVTTRR